MSGTKKTTYPNLNVLIVEDNMVNQKVTSAMLRHFGVVADVAENGQEALTMSKGKKYDLLLMDCQMPVMNGFDATREIRKGDASTTAGDVLILAMTANASPEDVKKCFDAGMNDIIAKPVELDILEEKLQKWLASTVVTATTDDTTDSGGVDFSSLAAEFDIHVLQELHNLMGDEYKTVLEVFIASLNDHVPNLQTAVKDGETSTVAGIAHTLKGSCANVGANELSHLCQQLMELAKAGDLSGADELMEKITQKYHKVNAALKQFI